MNNPPDIIGELATPAERRAGVQRAYDDGYQDGRLDVNRETEKAFESLKAKVGNLLNAVNENAEMVVGLRDQVDYWRNEFTRVNALVAEMTAQADEIHDEAYAEGWNDRHHHNA